MSGIEWTDATWNPVVGCTRVSAGCDNCYAVPMTNRLEGMGTSKYAGLTVLNRRGDRHFNGTVRCVEDDLAKPLRWQKPRMVFVNSMSDLFHESVPDEFIDRVFAVMALCPRHTFQILTKRPERMAEYFDSVADRETFDAEVINRVGNEDGERYANPAKGRGWPLPNVWLGTSCEDQKAADERIPHLLRCPAAVRFLSCEPLLAGVDLSRFLNLTGEVGRRWVIVGGESGPRSRPCDVAWIRSIVGQCRDAGVPVFVKQLGAHARMDERKWLEWKRPRDAASWADAEGDHPLCLNDRKGGDPDEWPDDLRVREMPACVAQGVA